MSWAIQEVEPVFVIDLNEIGRLGCPEGCLSAHERWTVGWWRWMRHCSWFRKYQVGEYLRVQDEDGWIYQALVVQVRDSEKLGHGYIVEPVWESATNVIITRPDGAEQ